VSATIVAKTTGGTTLLDLTGVSGIIVQPWTLSGVTYRAKTVEYDDVPGETVVQAVKQAESLVVPFTVMASTLAEALDTLEVITDAVCDPLLRSFHLVITYNNDRIETWTVIRPADCTAPEMDPPAASGVVSAALVFRVSPVPAVTYADTYES